MVERSPTDAKPAEAETRRVCYWQDRSGQRTRDPKADHQFAIRKSEPEVFDRRTILPAYALGCNGPGCATRHFANRTLRKDTDFFVRAAAEAAFKIFGHGRNFVSSAAYYLYSSISPGWHAKALQTASSVDSRIAFTLPFFNTEILAIVMPTFWASSVTLIFRFANMTSMLMMIAILVALYR
jgi:hypothetical protein